MRIIAGTAKGRRLKTPKGRTIRPTSDRVREAIFNIVGPDVVGARVLDLYAGTGAFGIEALSRGAAEVIFMDDAREAVALIDVNLRLTGLVDGGRIIKVKIEKGLDRLAKEPTSLNLIFLDPPYRISVSALRDICEKAARLLAAGGLMIVEHSTKLVAPDIDGMTATASKKYGDTTVTIYSKRGRK
ncbi:MAG: 16S rRNA (guanine(966)-N(2))-methyltransferase RsmD [Actinobacteria bacterium]|nr:16S rRNA (guanine(966)-N(2))-methyltransferase RsmD [Actinomycetota bacterium]